MSKVFVTESYLDDIADAIRGKNGTENTYKPPQMAAAITALPDSAVLDDKTITANGTYDPSDDDLDGYSEVTVNVPNSYAAGDEGKVVSNGALVAQTARSSEITENGTYDTTLNDEVTVNVSGGGGGVTELIDIFGSPSANSGDDFEITSDRSVYSTAYQYYAFNRLSGNSVWGSGTNSTPAWLMYKFKDGKKRIIKVFEFQTLVSAFGGGFSAASFQLQGSNDNFSTCDVLYDYSGGASDNIQTAIIQSNNAYSAFRIYITAIYQDRYPALNKIKAFGFMESDSE